MKIKLPVDFASLKSKSKIGRSARDEINRLSKITLYSLSMIIVICLVMSLMLHFSGGIGPWQMHVSNAMDNIIAAAIILIFLDAIMMLNNENRKKRDERRSIIRLNMIIQPVADMYIVRKNMVITPAEKTVRKFQINADFTVKDMKDMYGQSDLISDVGRSKIEMYAYYQSKLMDGMTHLVESVDFSFYQNLCDAAMKYINATMYGASALEALISFQNTMAGTKSMKSVVISGIKDEPENGNFLNANPTMKNVYLVHQMISEQEAALEEYISAMKVIMSEEPKEKNKKDYRE